MAAPARDHDVVPDESFDAKIQEQDGRIVVTLRGELDMASEADARLALDEAGRRSAELIASKSVEQVISLAGLEHRFTFRVGRVGGDSPDGSRGPDRGVAGPEAG